MDGEPQRCSCSITEEQLWSWVDREAPELAEHLAHCARCRQLAESLRSGIGRVSLGSAPPGQPLPARIGSYAIRRRLGEGGQGVVYEALQDRPHRRVALKVIKRTGGSVADVHLFQREVRTLARLVHPGIAAIHEAGQTAEGQHFFAMELVEGVPITEYANTRSAGPPPAAALEQCNPPPGAARSANRTRTPLDVTSRLRLFVKVADAINYAHQRGVIHRDLKPSNILVTERDAAPAGGGSLCAEIKVLDFGLARLRDDDGAASITQTEPGRIKGTPAYMSPEQARGATDEIDVRSDVYALGLILYELLTGQLPYDVQGRALHEIVGVICGQPPRRPRSIAHHLDADLETIVLKALEKEPARRYQSAAALIDDIERYLHRQPILARPPSATYHLRKMVARHKVPAGLIAAMLVLIVAFAAYAFQQSRRLARERDHALLARQNEALARVRAEEEAENARRAARQAERINAFLQDTLAFANPDISRGRDVTIRDMLDESARHLEALGDEEPDVVAALRDTLVHTYHSLGLYAQAESQARALLADRQARLGPRHPDTVSSMSSVAMSLSARGEFAEAETLMAEVVRLRLELLGMEHVDTLTAMNNHAGMLQQVGRLDEAEALWRDVLATERRVLGDDDIQTLHALGNLAALLRSRGKRAEAEPLMREALAARRRVLGDEHTLTLNAMQNLVMLLGDLGEVGEAEALLRDVLRLRQKLLGDEHPDTLNTKSSLAEMLRVRGQLAEAEKLYHEVLEASRRTLGEEHPKTLIMMNNLALTLTDQGRSAEAEEIFAALFDIAGRVLPQGHWNIAAFRRNYGHCLMVAGRFAEAEEVLLDAHETLRAALGPGHPQVLKTRAKLIELYETWGQPERADAFRTANGPEASP